jgi:hypothetical protein
MIFIHPRSLFRTQQTHVDHLRMYRTLARQASLFRPPEKTDHRKVLHLQIPFIPKITPRFRHLHPDNILYPDSKLSIGVVSWFIRDDMSRLKGCIIVCYTWTDTLRTLVNV